MSLLLIYTIPIGLIATLTLVFAPVSLSSGGRPAWHHEESEEAALKATAANHKIPSAPIHL